MNPLKKLCNTSDYPFDKTEVTGLPVVVDCMSVIHKTGFEKHTKIKNGLKRLRNSIFVQSNAKRIEMVCDSYLENSVKESLRTQRAINKPIKRIDLNLDSPVPSEIKKFWASLITKDTLATVFFYCRSKRSTKNTVLTGNDRSFDNSVTENERSFDD